MPEPLRIKPRALAPGDTIGIISPSWFGGPDFVPRAKRGIRTLESVGFRVRVGQYAFNTLGPVSDTPENRVADLHDMFADDNIAAIICTIGGDHSCHLLPLIDWDLIAAHPKIFMGFSDITVLNVAIWSQTGLVTFNGPTLLTEWAEFPRMPGISLDSALQLVATPNPAGCLPVATEWTDEFLDWESGEDHSRRRTHVANDGWQWIRPGDATGTLVGGCLESLQHLRGTPYWPDLTGAILFIETSESCTSPDGADAILMDYENMGVFDQIAGLLVARPYGMSPEQHEEFWQTVEERTRNYSFPVVGNMDFGHTSPMLTLPIGVMAQIDGRTRTVTVTEAAVNAPNSPAPAP